MIGPTLDLGSNSQYIVGSTLVLDNLVYVGSQTSGFSGATGTGTTVTFNLTGGVAATPAANDIVFVAYVIGTNNSINPSMSISGYTNAFTQLFVTDNQSTEFGVAYKIMPSTPDTTFVRSQTGNNSHAGAIVVHVWRNANTQNPLNVTPTTNTITNTVVVNPPAITPTTANSVILVAGGGAHLRGAINYGFPSDLTNSVRTSSNDDVDVSILVGSNTTWTSGSFDPVAWTFGSTDSTAYSCASASIVIQPRHISVPTYGNRKNSGVWNLQAHYEYMRAQYTGPGEVLFSAPGTAYFEVPPGITQISAMVVGGGGGGSGGDGGRGTTNGGGGGGGCAYGTFAVTPGEILTVVIGAGGTSSAGNSGTAGGPSSISRGATVLLSGGGGGGGIERNAGTAAGGTSTGTARTGGGTGGSGGTGSAASGATGGGGAGGLTGNGGNGGARATNGSAGAGGGGGGGAGVAGTTGNLSGAGGGVYPQGSDVNGTSGAAGTTTGTLDGGGGQGGGDGSSSVSGDGGYFGGGGAAIDDFAGVGGAGAQGIARIIWGTNRSFPSSNTAYAGQG